MTYLITFSTYGSHLHGDPRGSVNREHNCFKSPMIGENGLLRDSERRSMKDVPYLLDDRRRAILLGVIQSVCAYREWELFAIHVRTNHVHVVVEARGNPLVAIQNFKQYGSRALNRAGIDGLSRKRWTEGGSARRLSDRDERERAIRYVAEGQGEPMALFVAAIQK